MIRKIIGYLKKLRLSVKTLKWIVWLFLLYAVIGGSSGFFMFYKLWREKRNLTRSIAIEQKKRDWLTEEVQGLKNDPAKIEKVARQEYMMGAEDEVIIKIVE